MALCKASVWGPVMLFVIFSLAVLAISHGAPTPDLGIWPSNSPSVSPSSSASLSGSSTPSVSSTSTTSPSPSGTPNSLSPSPASATPTTCKFEPFVDYKCEPFGPNYTCDATCAPGTRRVDGSFRQTCVGTQWNSTDVLYCVPLDSLLCLTEPDPASLPRYSMYDKCGVCGGFGASCVNLSTCPTFETPPHTTRAVGLALLPELQMNPFRSDRLNRAAMYDAMVAAAVQRTNRQLWLVLIGDSVTRQLWFDTLETIAGHEVANFDYGREDHTTKLFYACWDADMGCSRVIHYSKRLQESNVTITISYVVLRGLYSREVPFVLHADWRQGDFHNSSDRVNPTGDPDVIIANAGLHDMLRFFEYDRHGVQQPYMKGTGANAERVELFKRLMPLYVAGIRAKFPETRLIYRGQLHVRNTGTPTTQVDDAVNAELSRIGMTSASQLCWDVLDVLDFSTPFAGFHEDEIHWQKEARWIFTRAMLLFALAKPTTAPRYHAIHARDAACPSASRSPSLSTTSTGSITPTGSMTPTGSITPVSITPSINATALSTRDSSTRDSSTRDTSTSDTLSTRDTELGDVLTDGARNSLARATPKRDTARRLSRRNAGSGDATAGESTTTSRDDVSTRGTLALGAVTTENATACADTVLFYVYVNE